jgi:hypothetical protein
MGMHTHTVETSDSGHSETGGGATSLLRTQLKVPKYFLHIVPTHFEPPKEDILLTKDKEVALKCP